MLEPIGLHDRSADPAVAVLQVTVPVRVGARVAVEGRGEGGVWRGDVDPRVPVVQRLLEGVKRVVLLLAGHAVFRFHLLHLLLRLLLLELLLANQVLRPPGLPCLEQVVKEEGVGGLLPPERGVLRVLGRLVVLHTVVKLQGDVGVVQDLAGVAEEKDVSLPGLPAGQELLPPVVPLGGVVALHDGHRVEDPGIPRDLPDHLLHNVPPVVLKVLKVGDLAGRVLRGAAATVGEHDERVPPDGGTKGAGNVAHEGNVRKVVARDIKPVAVEHDIGHALLGGALGGLEYLAVSPGLRP
mmetsp:Transcript_3147/g.10899  ORF Transcript_3147/g.10899 Transcript_3147/m.10899 type:complete len:296 (-) Transcript_3147:1551-2438(-)